MSLPGPISPPPGPHESRSHFLMTTKSHLHVHSTSARVPAGCQDARSLGRQKLVERAFLVGRPKMSKYANKHITKHHTTTRTLKKAPASSLKICFYGGGSFFFFFTLQKLTFCARKNNSHHKFSKDPSSAYLGMSLHNSQPGPAHQRVSFLSGKQTTNNIFQG